MLILRGRTSFAAVQWWLRLRGSLRFLIKSLQVFLNAVAQLCLTKGGCGVTGSAPIGQRILFIPGPRISCCQGVKVSWCVSVLRSEGLLEVRDSLGVLLSIGKNAPDMKVRETIIRPPLNRLFKSLQSFIQLALALKHHPQVVVGLSINGISLQGAPKSLFRFHHLSLPHEEHTIVVVSIREIGIQTNRFPVMFLGLFRLVRLPVEDNEIGMGQGQPGIKFESFQVRCDRILNSSRLFKLNTSLEDRGRPPVEGAQCITQRVLNGGYKRLVGIVEFELLFRPREVVKSAIRPRQRVMRSTVGREKFTSFLVGLNSLRQIPLRRADPAQTVIGLGHFGMVADNRLIHPSGFFQVSGSKKAFSQLQPRRKIIRLQAKRLTESGGCALSVPLLGA